MTILTSTLGLEHRLQAYISEGEVPCLKGPDGRCIVISPLAFWNYDRDELASDPNILDTLSNAKNVSIAGIPVTPYMVLAGRGSYEPHVGGNKFDYATFLALTYFFPNSACWGTSAERTQWVQTVQNAVAQNAEVTVQVPDATLIALEYDPHHSTAKGWSAISAFLYLAYIGFFAYVAWSVKRMDAVHSRLGVTFTALVEIAVSTITSMSVCALVGFKITMVPWELLPIVIVFVGAENMFNLVDAVGKTSVTLSVKQRIAEGLSRAGTSNTLKVVSYNAILGVIAVFSAGAVRQFCTFAIVVLVAHWFLAHTFFMAVLSIDIARLELEELLRRDTTLAPSVPLSRKDSQNSKPPRSGWQKLIFTTQNLLKGRAATNISLLMLLAIAATLYYTTYTASSSLHSSLSKPLGAVSRTKTRGNTEAISTAEHIWKVLNPIQTPLFHLRLELPTIITFSSKGDGITSNSAMHASVRSKYTMKTFKFVLWLLSIMVLPIAATTSALYGLLLYLMRNTELLEARPAAETTVSEDEKSLQGQISFNTLPRAFASDAELIAASKDGRIVVSVGLHNEIVMWNADSQKHVAIDPASVLLKMATSSSSAGSTITALTVDDNGRFFAIGTGAGHIVAWSIGKSNGRVKPLPVLSLDNSSAAVTELRFVPPLGSCARKTPGRTPPSSEPNSPESKLSNGTVLLAAYESGVAARWTLGDLPIVSFFHPSKRAGVVRVSLLQVVPDDKILIAFCLNDGTLELTETGDYEPVMLNDCVLEAGNPYDLVSKVHACRAEMGGSVRLVIAAVTEAGSVSLWDGLTSECISVLEEAYGRISNIKVSPTRCETCHLCGQLPKESISVAFAVDHDKIVQMSKLYLEDQTRRCSCARNKATQQTPLRSIASRESLGKRSRSNSNASSSQVGSPLIPRARLATAFETTTAFPVSGHGVHSRRASEKETTRRSSELLTVPFPSSNMGGGGGGGAPGEEQEPNSPTGDLSGSVTPTNSYASYSIWRNAVLVPLDPIVSERGSWGLADKVFVGVHRRPRSQAKTKVALHSAASIVSSLSSSGLTDATLERWELWMFDPAVGTLRTSLLSEMTRRSSSSSSSLSSGSSSSSSLSRTSSSSIDSSRSSIEGVARLPFTRVSPLVLTSSRALAGFGNTIGVFYL
ncbi:hypothetical protein D9613_003272 [Agrocybe pediades]|uniref:Sterol regulatory element-binding protein cleavage-activating protein n=1 Tax=Agrocybe pediades TaxID=84607 RepID=A0A8H4QQ16_9AGAR|nr:hypothetical protein D9613_003272 [Agrocybe pediades]